MALTASSLRQNVYRLLDQVLETGEPLEIRRKGQVLKVVKEHDAGSKLANLTPHHCINGDPEEIVHCDWSDQWNPDATECVL